MHPMRIRFLVAMGIPLSACKRDDLAATATQATTASTAATATTADQDAQGVAASATTASTPSAMASTSPGTTTSATASAPAPTKSAPAKWNVTFNVPGPEWCRNAYADCFPRGHVPASTGGASCPPTTSVLCGCGGGVACPDPSKLCDAPLVDGVSRAQSALYAGGACCYQEPQHCTPPWAGRALTAFGARVHPSGDGWARTAAAEHASVASFARASLELLALGAPADLVADTHRAALDELRHARIAYALAGSGEAGPLHAAIAPLTPPTFESFVRATFHDACVEETLGAIAMRETAARYEGETARAILSIAEDEERHAELAWRTLAWVVRVGGPAAREALDEALRTARRSPDPVMRDVIVPCASALLDRADD